MSARLAELRTLSDRQSPRHMELLQSITSNFDQFHPIPTTATATAAPTGTSSKGIHVVDRRPSSPLTYNVPNSKAMPPLPYAPSSSIRVAEPRGSQKVPLSASGLPPSGSGLTYTPVRPPSPLLSPTALSPRPGFSPGRALKPLITTSSSSSYTPSIQRSSPPQYNSTMPPSYNTPPTLGVDQSAYTHTSPVPAPASPLKGTGGKDDHFIGYTFKRPKVSIYCFYHVYMRILYVYCTCFYTVYVCDIYCQL